MSQTLTLQAGEVGKTLSDVPGITITGYTVNLLVQDSSGAVKSYPMTVQSDGKTAQYTTLGTEFASPGNYKIQMELINAGDKFYTSVGSVKVVGNLA